MLSVVTMIYLISTIICLSIGQLNPLALLYLDFLFFFLWTYARVMVNISRLHLMWLYINIAVVLLETSVPSPFFLRETLIAW